LLKLQEKFKQIVEAYGVLSNDIKRREYDNSLNPQHDSSGTHEYTNDSYSKNSSNRYTYGYTYEKFYGKPSSPQYDEDMFKEFHKQNIKQRKEGEGSFLANNIELVVLT
jgi:DnaJ-class molecular chaperone with C-terminal Zn finger domain